MGANKWQLELLVKEDQDARNALIFTANCVVNKVF
jgi:hypothetical protein